MSGFGFRVSGSGVRVLGLGFLSSVLVLLMGVKFRVLHLFGVWDSGFGIRGLGCYQEGISFFLHSRFGIRKSGHSQFVIRKSGHLQRDGRDPGGRQHADNHIQKNSVPEI